MQKKQTILVVASLLVVVLSVTLAYFTAQIIGKGKDVSVSSADLKIVFTDTDGNIEGNGITPGWGDTKTFTIENKSNETYKYNIVIQDLINTFVTKGYLQYKITSTNGGYNMTEFKDVPKSDTAKDKILAYSVSIPVGVTQSYTVEFKYANDESVDQSDDMGRKLSGKLFITEGTEQLTLLSQILKDNPTRNTRDTYDSVFTNNTTGTLFTATEKNVHNITDTTVYYYAGNTTNNWVKFAGFYWRIIRTNHDSSIRLLYVGTSPDTTSGNIGEGNFNSSYNSPKYVGYKYGEDTSLDTIRNNTTDSKIKTYVDNWYKNNLINYTKYLSTSAVYCNDRSLGTGQTYSTNSLFEFASYYRMDYNTNGAKANPSYNCTDRRDAFSVDNTSAKLTYPVSLMTTDEMAFAGGVAYIKTNTSYAWFISNSAGSQVSSSWWSLSPDGWNGARSCVWRWDSDNAYLNIVDVGIDDAVRPVLSLKSCIKYSTGNGSSETPYEIVETSSGC